MLGLICFKLFEAFMYNMFLKEYFENVNLILKKKSTEDEKKEEKISYS